MVDSKRIDEKRRKEVKVMALLLILFGVCTSLAEGVLIKKYNSRHTEGGFFFTGLISLFAMLFFIITDQDGFYFPEGIWIYSAVAGDLYAAASFMTYMALRCGSFAMSMLILSYSIVFTIGYGLIFLKEKTSVYTYVGLAIVMVSLYLTRGKNEESHSEKRSNKFSLKWLILIVLSAVFSGLYSVVSRMQQIRFENRCTNEFMMIALGISCLILVVAGVLKEGKSTRYIIRNGGPYAIGAGISNGITNMLSLVVNTMIAISIASPIRASLKIVMSFLLSKLVFKEKFLKRQILGVLLGAVALVLLRM